MAKCQGRGILREAAGAHTCTCGTTAGTVSSVLASGRALTSLHSMDVTTVRSALEYDSGSGSYCPRMTCAGAAYGGTRGGRHFGSVRRRV